MMSVRKTLLCSALLAGCTFSTGANDREVTDALDLDLNMTGMTAHAQPPGPVQVDVALVHPRGETAASDENAVDSMTLKYDIRGRVRVLMPPVPSSGKYPDVHARLSRILIEDESLGRAEKLQVLFYADNNNDFIAEPLIAGVRNEHSWTRDVPASGEITFPHNIMFQNFYDAEVFGVGGDLVLDVPTLSPARSACLDAELAKLMKVSFSVGLVSQIESNRSQVAGFQMYAGNTVPKAPVRFRGLADVGEVYGVESFLDEVRFTPDARQTQAASVGGLTIPFVDWFPVADATIAACLAL